MHFGNLLWLEAEAQARMAERRAQADSARRRTRPAAIRFPGTGRARRIVGGGLVALGEWLVEPQSLVQRRAS